MAAGNPSIIAEPPGRRWRFGGHEYVEVSRELFVSGVLVKLESKPLDVLQHLLEHPAKILTKDELIGAAWNMSTSDQSLATAISKLRKAFGGPRDSIILNVSGIGYRMAVPVVSTIDKEQLPALFHLENGQPIPGHQHWFASKRLGPAHSSTVWIAENSKTHRAHVFKFAVDGVRLRALQRELALSRLFEKAAPGHGGFVRIISANLDETPYFLESEYGGINLFEFSETEDFAQMPLLERIALAAQLADIVAAAHALGVLHNDLKPSNVLVFPHAETNELGAHQGQPKHWQVKVSDFGVASLSDPEAFLRSQITHHGAFESNGESNGTSSFPGSAMYRAPEMVPGATPTALGDIYALGILLYQILCGDFLEPPSPGWEARIPDILLRSDIADAANIDPKLRLSSSAELAARLRSVEMRRARKKQIDEALAAAQKAEQASVRERLRRPWIVLAITALATGLLVSLWFVHLAARDRDLANARNRDLSSMYNFLANDLLSQTNPLASPAGPGQVTQETLVEAIDRAIPSIDKRFSKDPETAGHLHETIAAALDSRTQYKASEAEFEAAAKHFRQAEGSLSQNALIAEFRRENTEMREMIPDSIARARQQFEQQNKIVGRLPFLTPELQARQALSQSGIIVFGPHPEQAIPVLTAALTRAKAIPGFDPYVLSALEQRFAGVYLRLGNGAEMERIARECIGRLTVLDGPNSSTLSQSMMFLEESFYLQGKYKEAVAQGEENYKQFSKVLGPDHQLTLGSLDTKGGAECRAGDFETAIRDDLALHKAAASTASGKYIAIDSLIEASVCESHSGRYSSAIAHAGQIVEEGKELPEFTQIAGFIIAESLIGEQEAEPKANPVELRKAEDALKRVDLASITKGRGTNEYEGYFNIAEARLAILLNHPQHAGALLEQAAPFLRSPSVDPYEARAFSRVQAYLIAHPPKP